MSKKILDITILTVLFTSLLFLPSFTGVPQAADKLGRAQRAPGSSVALYGIRLIVCHLARQICLPVTDSVQHGFDPNQAVILPAKMSPGARPWPLPGRLA